MNNKPFNPNPTVSIIINNYNYTKFVAKAIESALNQTYSPVEVIVVDDGSEDNSMEIIHTYRDRVTVVSKKNGGQASAINQGFQASQGDIISLLDADDYLYPDAIQKVVHCWKSQSEQETIAQIQCLLNLVDSNDNFMNVYPRADNPFDNGRVEPLLLYKGRYRTTVTSGLSFSRKTLDQIMPIPESEFRISADGYLVTVAPFYGLVASVNSPIGARVHHDNNLWASNTPDKLTKKFQRSLEHDAVKCKYLRQTAEKFGRTLRDDANLHELDHLMNRIASLRMDPKHHPYKDDSRLNIAILGCRTVLQNSKLTISRRFLLFFWFIVVGLSPKFVATRAITWFFSSSTRPKSIKTLIKRFYRSSPIPSC